MKKVQEYEKGKREERGEGLWMKRFYLEKAVIRCHMETAPENQKEREELCQELSLSQGLLKVS